MWLLRRDVIRHMHAQFSKHLPCATHFLVGFQLNTPIYNNLKRIFGLVKEIKTTHIA